MSHSRQIGDVSFIYDNDMTGDCKLVDVNTGQTINTRVSILLVFAAGMVAQDRIASIERSSTSEILGLSSCLS